MNCSRILCNPRISYIKDIILTACSQIFSPSALISIAGILLWSVFTFYINNKHLTLLFIEKTGQTIIILPHSFIIILLIIGQSAVLYFIYQYRKQIHKSAIYLGCLPLSLVGIFCIPYTTPYIGANVYFYVSILLVSISLAVIQPSRSEIKKNDCRIIFLSILIAHTLTGIYFTESIGPHSGDEGHYITIARSIWEDGDLDLHNNLNFPPDYKRFHFHISPNSKDGKWYSWHPFGLSILISPSAGLGLWFAHLVMAVFSGILAYALLKLMEYFSIDRFTAYLFITLNSIGLLWLIYASRIWPELPGASLIVLSVFAVLVLAEKDQWKYAIALGVSLSMLHWLHIRFIAPSLTIFAIFSCIMIYRIFTINNRSYLYIFLFVSILFALSLFLYYVTNQTLFEKPTGYAYLDKTFVTTVKRPWHYLWKSFTSNRGLLYSFPIVLFAVPSIILSLKNAKLRMYSIFSLLLIIPYFCYVGARDSYTGGSALPGRYFVATVFLLIPLIAKTYTRLSVIYRTIVVLSLIIPSMLSIFLLARLPEYRKSFIDPWSSLPIIEPWLQGLYYFLNDRDPYHILALAAYVIIAVIFSFRPRRLIFAITPMIVLISCCFYFAIKPAITYSDPKIVAKRLSSVKSDKAIFLASMPSHTNHDLFVISNRIHPLNNANHILPSFSAPQNSSSSNIVRMGIGHSAIDYQPIWKPISYRFYEYPGIKRVRVELISEISCFFGIRVLVESNTVHECWTSVNSGVLTRIERDLYINQPGILQLFGSVTVPNDRIQIFGVKWSPSDPQILKALHVH